MLFLENQQIGSYTLIRKLGTGGFGEVWLAEKRSQFVTKKVAVKLPLDEQVDFKAIKQEAELWEQASGHANVLPIIDADIIDGQVVIVSEYADGGSLADKLKREGKLPIQQAVEMTIGILNGLEFLHKKRIIHRDIKPANILLQDDTPRLADFGISRAMHTTAISSTIIGTDAFMSPESFRGLRTIATDIWAVGVVLYQLLNGRLPFPQENPSEKMYSILQENFAPLSNDIPQELRRIVEKALAKLPENRFQSASEMRNGLKNTLAITEPTPKFVENSIPIIKQEIPFPEIQPAKIEETEIITEIRHLSPSFKSESSEKPKRNGFYLAVMTAVFLLGAFSMVMIYSWIGSSRVGTEKNVNSNSVSTNPRDSNLSFSNTNSDLTNSTVSSNIIKNNKITSVTKSPTPKNNKNDDSTISRNPTPKTTPNPDDKIKKTSPNIVRMCRPDLSKPSNWGGRCVPCDNPYAIPNTTCPDPSKPGNY